MEMTKKDFINAMAEAYEMTKVDAKATYEAVFDMLTSNLENGNSVAVPGLGKFVIKERAERTARNPQTGDEVAVPAHKVVAFKISKTLKDTVAEL